MTTDDECSDNVVVVFGLCGKAGSGKDTFANFLVQKHKFIKVSFAEALKDALSILFGWDRHLLEGNTKSSREWRERVDEFWSRELKIPDFTPRKAMQTVGTDLFRNHFHPNFWVSILKRKILFYVRRSGCPGGIVVTDCRFPNEIQMLKETFGTSFHLFEISSNTAAKDKEFLAHPSETSLEDFLTSSTEVVGVKKYIIHNDMKTTKPFEKAYGEYAYTVKKLAPVEETLS